MSKFYDANISKNGEFSTLLFVIVERKSFFFFFPFAAKPVTLRTPEKRVLKLGFFGCFTPWRSFSCFFWCKNSSEM